MSGPVPVHMRAYGGIIRILSAGRQVGEAESLRPAGTASRRSAGSSLFCRYPVDLMDPASCPGAPAADRRARAPGAGRPHVDSAHAGHRARCSGRMPDPSTAGRMPIPGQSACSLGSGRRIPSAPPRMLTARSVTPRATELRAGSGVRRRPGRPGPRPSRSDPRVVRRRHRRRRRWNGARWNPAAERIFGYTAQEMVGSSIFRLIPPDLHDEEHHIRTTR